MSRRRFEITRTCVASMLRALHCSSSPRGHAAARRRASSGWKQRRPVEPTYRYDAVATRSPTLVGQVSLLFFVGDELHARTLREDESFVVGRNEPADLVLRERTLEDLPTVLWESPPEASAAPAAALIDEASSLRAPPLSRRVREFEIAAIREALERCGRSQARAAQALGLPRRTLAHKIRVYGLAEPRVGRALRAASNQTGAMTLGKDDAR